MKNYKELQAQQAAEQEQQRCRIEFSKLCQRLPNLPPNEAVFGILLDYFQPETLLFDFQSAASAIGNNETLAKRLGYRDDEQIERDNQKAVKTLNDHNRALKPEELHEELKQRDREFRENSQRKPQPPADLTRTAFFKASPEQARQWAAKYSFAGLNEHWARLEAGNV
jgi:hypothetical protein